MPMLVQSILSRLGCRFRSRAAVELENLALRYGDSPKFSGLNRIAVAFEYEADAEGNTKSKLREWK